jgi:hypothetical protein
VHAPQHVAQWYRVRTFAIGEQKDGGVNRIRNDRLNQRSGDCDCSFDPIRDRD